MATLEQTLRSAFAKFNDVPALAPVRVAFERAMTAHEAFKAKAGEIANDKRLSPIGRKEAAQKFVGEKSHELHRASKSVPVLRDHVARARAKLVPAEASPMDSEIRSALRGMKTDERNKLLLDVNADTSLLEAALRAPNALSGIDNFTRDQITTRVIERHKPGALAQITLAEEAIELVEVAARVAFDSAREVAEFPNNDALAKFVDESVGGTGVLDADIERGLAPLAELAA